MLRLNRFVFLLVAGLALAIEGCAAPSPGRLDTHVSGSNRALLAPVQSRSILLESRNVPDAAESRIDVARPALTVVPRAMVFLSQSGTMFTQNSDGTIGIRALGMVAARPGLSEHAREADLFGNQNGILSPALVQLLYPSCPLPD
jgi:hypothetical protein